MRLYFLCLCFLCSFMLAKNPSSLDSKTNGSIAVLVSVLPQKEMVSRIGGDSVDVVVLVPSNKSPEMYEPSIAQMKYIEKAQVFFGIGMPYERTWLTKFKQSNPQMQYYDLSQVLQDDTLNSLNIKNDVEAQHSRNTLTHTHNPHIWLSIKASKIQSNAIAKVLSTMNPAKAKAYENAAKDLNDSLDTLQVQIQSLFSQAQANKSFVTYHPAFSYFADEFGLKEYSLEVQGKEIKGKALGEIIKQSKKEGIKVVFIQPQFAKTRVQMFARELNASIIELNPLREDWLYSLGIYACQIAFGKPAESTLECIKKYLTSLDSKSIK